MANSLYSDYPKIKFRRHYVHIMTNKKLRYTRLKR
jgi:hypothetical protein